MLADEIATAMQIWIDGDGAVLVASARPPTSGVWRYGPDLPASADDCAPVEGELFIAPGEDGNGLVVTDVDPDSDAADRGIQAGDVITSINSMPVNGTSDVEKALADASKSGRKAVLFQITRDETNRFVALPLAKG